MQIYEPVKCLMHGTLLEDQLGLPKKGTMH